MSDKMFITKCCVCGREKTEDGWRFRSDPLDGDAAYSHGFCAYCYETELMKIKMRTLARSSVLSA